ncbi:MAG TPA: hypothetical protein VE646_00880 [Actinomycetota bacterium]|jgi:hypothetical protein|nr:hypothetical protein [Actinomycetota bacterium]
MVLPGAAYAKGPPATSFCVDGTLYWTVGTPTDLSNTGAPDSAFDTIYEFFGAQPDNVATAAPGDRDHNGGRWHVHGLSFPDGYAAALSSGDRTTTASSTTTPRCRRRFGAGRRWTWGS